MKANRRTKSPECEPLSRPRSVIVGSGPLSQFNGWYQRRRSFLRSCRSVLRSPRRSIPWVCVLTTSSEVPADASTVGRNALSGAACAPLPAPSASAAAMESPASLRYGIVISSAVSRPSGPTRPFHCCRFFVHCLIGRDAVISRAAVRAASNTGLGCLHSDLDDCQALQWSAPARGERAQVAGAAVFAAVVLLFFLYGAPLAPSAVTAGQSGMHDAQPRIASC